VFAIDAVAVIALNDDDRAGRGQQLVRSHERELVGQTRKGGDLTVRHAEPTADGQVVSEQRSVAIDERHDAQIVRVQIYRIIARRRHRDFELSRQKCFAVDRFFLRRRAVDDFAVLPNFVVCRRARSQ